MSLCVVLPGHRQIHPAIHRQQSRITGAIGHRNRQPSTGQYAWFVLETLAVGVSTAIALNSVMVPDIQTREEGTRPVAAVAFACNIQNIHVCLCGSELFRRHGPRWKTAPNIPKKLFHRPLLTYYEVTGHFGPKMTSKTEMALWGLQWLPGTASYGATELLVALWLGEMVEECLRGTHSGFRSSATHFRRPRC